MHRSIALLIVLSCLLLSSICTCHAAPPSVNIRDFGAQGNGIADDTPAIVSSIAKAKSESLPVYVPRGRYIVTKTIDVDGVAIQGDSSNAWPADIDSLPQILAQKMDGPCFRVTAGGSIRGLAIDYIWPRDSVKGPAAILVTGGGVYLSNLRIRYAYDGISTDAVHNVGRLNIENVFMASIQHEGVRVTGTLDVPRLCNVEVWNNGQWKDSLDHGIGFHLGRNDGMRMTDCFAFAMQTAFLFEPIGATDDTKGVTLGQMNGCSSDYCGHGVVVHGDHMLSIGGCTFWSHGAGLIVDGAGAQLQMANCELHSNGGPDVQVLSATDVVITGCSLFRPMKEYPGPAVELKGGTVVLGSNYMDCYGNGVEVADAVTSANITGNTIKCRGGKSIVGPSGATFNFASNISLSK